MIAVAALMVSIAAYGQGQFVFNNRIPPDINAKIQLTDGTALAGTAYTVQLLAGAAGTPVAQLQPIGTTDFRTGAAAGYVNALTPTVPGLGEGKSADVVLRIFAGVGTGGAALTPDLGPFTVTLHESPNTPSNLPMGTTPLSVTAAIPEPATLALGIIGLGALLAIRRRN